MQNTKHTTIQHTVYTLVITTLVTATFIIGAFTLSMIAGADNNLVTIKEWILAVLVAIVTGSSAWFIAKKF